ncbi:MAG: DUF5009 domain-containing protein [Chitinophagaceae bacterium]|nr:DUF5009 domain-containing protein [Chitinophagaceae bacterium]MCW5929680.1 DUF5009 domain-containing protein [Chitinophagaceae bacterium]
MKQRFYSLDVFRGATVAFMILVNNPGSWSYIYKPLGHAQWHGCTPTDLVFPFFLFAVGNSLSFVIPRLQTGGAEAFWKKTTRRTLLIFLAGLLLSWFPFVRYDADGVLIAKRLADLRIPGVLQRIAVCYFFASIITYYLGPRGAFWTAAGLLGGYWLLCLFAGGEDPYSLNGWFGLKIDKWVLGENHMYKGEGTAFDPEGIASTIPAIAQVIGGYLVGNYIIKKQSVFLPGGNYSKVFSALFLTGVVCVAAGLCWHLVFPINKKIWTSSYVLFSTGFAIILLTSIIFFTEIRGWRTWGRFFDVFGKNPLFIFLLSGVVARLYGLFRIKDLEKGNVVYKTLGKWGYDHLFVPLFGNLNGSLFYAIFHVLLFFIIAWWLDKKKIYIKL